MKLVSATVLALMAVACNSEKIDAPVRYGEISVSLGTPDVEVVTRTPETLDPNSAEAAGYTVRIFDTESSSAVYTAAYDQFEAQALELGTYYVTAENYDPDGAEAANDGLGDMRLAGRSADIVLSSAGQKETATINCTVKNAKVSVVYDSSVEGRFSDLKVVLEGGTTPDRSIEIAEQPVGKEIETWFNPCDNLVYTITGIYDPNGIRKPVQVTNSQEPMTLDAQDHIQLRIQLNLEHGQILVPEITFDTAISDPELVDGEFNPYK